MVLSFFCFGVSNISECGNFAFRPLLVAPFAFLLKCIHVIHVVGAEKCEDHDGAIHFVFLAKTKCELENFQQCHLVLFKLVLLHLFHLFCVSLGHFVKCATFWNMLPCVVTHGSVFRPSVVSFLFPCLPSLDSFQVFFCHVVTWQEHSSFHLVLHVTSFTSFAIFETCLVSTFVDTFPSPESR